MRRLICIRLSPPYAAAAATGSLSLLSPLVDRDAPENPLLQQARELRARTLDPELVLHLPPARAAEPLAQLAALGQPCQRLRQQVGAAGQHQQARLPVLHHLRHAHHQRADHRQSGGHRLEQHHAQPLGEGGQAEQLGVLVERAQLVLADGAREADVQPQLAGQPLERLPLGTLAHEGRGRFDALLAQRGQRVEQQRVPLAGHEPRDGEHPQRPGGRTARGRLEAVGVDAAAHGMQAVPLLALHELHQLRAREIAVAHHEARAAQLVGEPVRPVLEQLAAAVHREAPRPLPTAEARRQQRQIRADVGEVCVQVADAVAPALVPDDERLGEVEQPPEDRSQTARGQLERQREGGDPAQRVREQASGMGGQQTQKVRRQHGERASVLLAIRTRQQLPLERAAHGDRVDVEAALAQRPHLVHHE